MNFNDSLSIAKFNPKDFIPDIIWAIPTFFLTNYLIYELSNQFLNPPDFFRDEFLPMPISALRVVVWVFLYFLTKPIFEWVLTFYKKGVEYRFNLNDWPSQWLFHGGVKIESNPPALVVQQSPSGCLLKNYLWGNCEITFEMKYFTEVKLRDQSGNENYLMRSLGILFKADNHGNCYMIELLADHDDVVIIKPHVRVYGKWEPVDYLPLEKFDLNQFLEVRIVVNDCIATVSINGRLLYNWVLPTHSDLRDTEKVNDYERVGKSKESLAIPKIQFRNRAGMIGFRADWNGQGAVVKGLKIQNLSKLETSLLPVVRPF